MAYYTDPVFVGEVKSNDGPSQSSTANTGRSTPGTPNDLVYAHDGTSNRATWVEAIHIAATSSTTAGLIGFFLYDGSVWEFWFDWPVPASSAPSTSIAAYSEVLNAENCPHLEFALPAGWKIGWAPRIAEEFNLVAQASYLES